MAKVVNTISRSGGGGTEITVVANYSALPDPTTVSGQFYWAEASQGTSWLPGSLGGTYYNSGMYYSNGITWQFMNVPYQATQATVNTGTNDNQFVTPNTLKNQNYLATIAYADAKVADIITDGVTTIAPSQNAVFDALALKQDKLITTNRQSASYTLVLTDATKLVEMDVASANNLTVPLNSSVAFPTGTIINISQYGAGRTTVVATGGVTIRSTNGWLKLNARYSPATLVKIGTDEWYLFGDLNA